MNDIMKTVGKYGIVPVIKIDNADNAVTLAKALVAGGLPVAEITFRTAAALDAIYRITSNMPDVLVGAGTVLNEKQASDACKAGAKFIVSPGLNLKIVDWCIEHKIPVIPGVVTPTEVMLALEKGLDVLKLFPAEEIGGVKYIKALTPVFECANFIPTGGINVNNLEDYIRIPTVLAIGGSWLASHKLISENKYSEITLKVEEAMHIIRRIRREDSL